MTRRSRNRAPVGLPTASRLLLGGLVVLLAGCGGRTPAPSVPVVHTESTVVVSPEGVTNVAEILDAADRKFDEGGYDEAEALFLRAADVDVSDGERARALLGAAVAADVAGRPERALELYLRAERTPGELRDPGLVVRRLPREKLLVRILRLGMYLDVELDLEARFLAEPPRPGSLDALGVLAFRASRALDGARLEEASSFLAEGERIVSELDLDRLPRLPLEAAPFFLAKGRLFELRAQAILFSPLPPNFAEVLEERCRLLLLAQSAFSDAMRAEDAAYSARAGLRIAGLYESLHRDLLALERPASADTRERALLLEAALRLRYAVLLDKAETMMDHTLTMIRRTALDARYVADAETALARLRAARAAEAEALARTGIAREDLERVLADLEREAQTRPRTPSPPSPGP